MKRKFDKHLDDLRRQMLMMPELKTIKQLINRARVMYGDRPQFIEKKGDERVVTTMREFTDDIDAVGTALLELGLKGKHIAIIGENSVAWLEAFFGIVNGVGVAIPIDKEMTDEDISALLTKGDVSAVFVTKNYLKTARLHVKNDPRCKYVFTINKKVKDENFIYMPDLIARGRELVAAGDISFISAETKPDDTAAILFTSGTTGPNKGVMLSNINFVSNTDGIIRTIMTERTSMSFLPMNHAYELTCDILTATYMNATIFVNDKIANFLPNLREFKPDAFGIVPLVTEEIYKGIWRGAEEKGQTEGLKKLIKLSNFLLDRGIDLRYYLFTSVRKQFGDQFPTFSCGGAPARADYIRTLCDIGFNIYGGYGLTEATPTVSLNMEAREKPLSSGKPICMTQIRIDEPDENGIGEICIRGKNITSGYYKDPAATKASFDSDGWFRTGDYGRIDPEDGDLYVTGRKKNLIVLDNGKNISPEDIESFVMEHLDYIRDVVAIEAVKDIHGQQKKIIAVVVYASTDDVPETTEEELTRRITDDIAAADRELPSYKKIQDVFVTYEPFELTTTLKPIRSKIVERYNAARAAK